MQQIYKAAIQQLEDKNLFKLDNKLITREQLEMLHKLYPDFYWVTITWAEPPKQNENESNN